MNIVYECFGDVLKAGGLTFVGSNHKWNLFSKQTVNWQTLAGRSLVHVTSSGKRVQVWLMKITTVKHRQIQGNWPIDRIWSPYILRWGWNIGMEDMGSLLW